MANFEKYRPQLKPGRLIPHGEKVIFEIEEPFDQIVLPVEVVDFMLLCNGEHTVADIIELVYKRRGTIQFKAIYRTLNYLKSRNFLQNGDELEVSEPADAIKEFHFISFRPFFNLPIGRRIFNEQNFPGLFYVFSMATIIAAILSFQFANSQWLNLSFLRIDGSYVRGLLFSFFMASLLLSMKCFLKCLLLIFLTGRAYNFTFTFSGFAAYFSVKSDSLFLVSNRLYIVLFHLAVTLCYFPLLGATYFFFPNLPHMNESMGLCFVLFLFELDPFRESEISYLFRSFFNDDTLNKLSSYLREKPLLSMLHPFERNRDHSLYFFFTHVALLWSAAVSYTLYRSIAFHHSMLNTVLRSGPLYERAATLITATALLSLAAMILYNAIKVLYLAMVLPLTRFTMRTLRHSRSHKVEFFENKEVLAALTELPLFSYFSHELLNMIVDRSIIREYKTGTPVIIQGNDGVHLYVLLSGQLRVQKQLPSGRIKVVGDILPPSIFGEVAVIEEVKRTASVISMQKSIVVEIPARMLRQIAEEAQYIRELESFRNAIMVNQFFTSAPVFRDLSEHVVQMFVSKGKIDSFVPDQVVFKQGERGDEFYLLLRGSVGVSVNGHPVSRIQQGGFFGEISMIADVPRTATIYAIEATQVLRVSRDAFWEILSHDINIAMFIESVGEMRIREDIEIIRAGRAKVA